MGHGFLDRYSDLNSFIHRLDPRTKIGITLLFILLVVVTPPVAGLTFALCFIFIGLTVALSRLPPGYALKRSLLILPFVVLVTLFVPFFHQGEVVRSYSVSLWEVTITRSGLLVLWGVLIKSWLAFLSLILLTSTTRFPELLQALEKLRMPRTMILILAFLYRYLFVLVDEALRMQRARDSRSSGGGWIRGIRAVGNMIGTLFLRSYERGERVYGAMLARGFEGQIPSMNRLCFSRADLYFSISALTFLSLAGWTAVFH
jgi:cobalt/nickel transport system permease protein